MQRGSVAPVVATMQRRIFVIAGLVAVIALVVWQRRGDNHATSTNGATTGSSRSAAGSTVGARPRVDPKSLVRGSLAGVVTEDGKVPIGGARACATGHSDELAPDLLREPTCVTADAQGKFKITGLYPAKYTVSGAARTYRPAVHHPGGDRKKTQVQLVAAEHKTGIAIALRPGGVEVTGVVNDLTGGPIANARVWAREAWGDRGYAATTTETDAQGKFSLWVKPGELGVSASADGYADSSESVRAPGKLELLLTPESSLAGTVVDAATNQPVEGARVTVGAADWGWDDGASAVFTDGQGAFRIDRLTPGRYVAASRTARGYGRTEGSALVGLGQHVDGVIVKLFPARRIDGKVVISTTNQPCEEPSVSLREPAKNKWVETRRTTGGSVYADGVLPGKYQVSVRCDGYLSHEKYEPITIADQDATGLVWEVDPGATIRGRVLTKTGDPVEGADIYARTIGGPPRAKGGGDGTDSDREGRYELGGLRAGTYKIDLSSDRGLFPRDGVKVEIAAGASVERDLTIEDGGSIKGTVVDAEGKPVAGIEVGARAMTAQWGGDNGKSDDAGNFTLHPIRAGDYRVTASRSWSDQLRKPGTTDDSKQGEKISVRANQIATVRLVVESQSAGIKGIVVDADGKPVADAFVSAARESDAAGAQKSSVGQTRWNWNEQPVLTSTEGAFTVTKLSPGSYTVRAYRKGGGEAVAEHVATGATAKLQIKSTGTVEGTVRVKHGTVPDELEVEVKDLTTGFSREESFFKTGGRYVIRDVPKGHFEIEAKAEGGNKQVELELAEGESRTIDLELDALVSITGRLVELGTTRPAPNVRMLAMLAKGGGGFSFSMDDDQSNITDEAGRFTVKHVPTGKLQIRAWPKDSSDSDYASATVIRTVEGTGTVDIGEIGILKKRVKRGDPVGELGVNFAQQPRDTAPEKRELKISFIDPQGAAAKTELKVGDVFKTIDGIDISGENSGMAGGLMRAPPGTKLALGLARGVVVTVVLAAP